MNTKKIISEALVTVCCFEPGDVFSLEKLSKELEMAKEEHTGYDEYLFKIQSLGESYYKSTFLTIIGNRFETDREFELRLKHERTQKIFEDERERKLYESLKRKFLKGVKS